MKKRIVCLIFILLLTGCKASYNLTISGNVYSESVTITAENSEEQDGMNLDFIIPVDKEEYDIGLDGTDTYSDVYEHSYSNNNLVLSYDFTMDSLINSSAVSQCYDKLNVYENNDKIIISTSTKATCFSNNPPLSSLDVNITVDREVINHNADSVNGNVYTWYINKDNESSKSINLILDDYEEELVSSSSQVDDNDKDDSKKIDYGYYIFCAILLIVFLIGYFVFNKIKKNSEDID